MEEIKDISKEEFIKQAKELGTSDNEIKKAIKSVEKDPICTRGLGYAFELELLRNAKDFFSD
ncbi:MAG: hypothetical protein RR405_00215 [Clostridia bacterium]